LDGLDGRKQKILAAVVEQYIAHGEPVGSKVICGLLDMAVSSATVRNELSELSEMGYLEQPHTSAGRVPSQKGYRYYVDRLMSRRRLSDAERQKIAGMLTLDSGDPEKLLEVASSALAHLTNCAAISTLPSDESALIRKVELICVGKRTVMIILLTSTGILKSRAGKADSDLNEDALASFHQIIKHHFLNLPVADVSIAMIQTLAASLGEKAFAMTPLLVMLAELCREVVSSDIKLEGQNNLLTHHEYEGSVFDLLRFLASREQLRRIVDSSENKPLHIVIGSENSAPQMAGSSMILAKYDIDGREGGRLGILGPTRIDYGRMMPHMEYLTETVSRLLSELLSDD